MNILDTILATKREEVAQGLAKIGLSSMRQQAEDGPDPRPFLKALHDRQGIRLLAEIKKASPSKGILREDFDPVWIGQQYELGGAHALSILTDEHYFQGSLAYLTAVREQVRLPVLRKDFIIHPFQVYEARAAGADGILFIAECLEEKQLQEMVDVATDLGMQPLIELHQDIHLEMVLRTGCRLIGVNNRDLKTFEVDLERTLRLKPRIPADRYLVAESGIATHEDVKRLWEVGVSAMLVGESLVRQPQPAMAVRKLLQGDVG